VLFHSNDFLFFFAGILLLYYLCRYHLMARNVLLLGASYVFYGWWDYRFVSLLLLSSGIDFAVGLGIGRAGTPGLRRLLLVGSISANLLLLGFFKYFNFFRESLVALLGTLGVEVRWHPWNVILPLGISFYTFQSLSYVIDVYRRKVRATTNPIQFLAYVSFFPQLVAGPIERPTHLLPQFERALEVNSDKLERGVWLIIWGMFKKVVIADNLAPLVDMAYQLQAPTGPVVILGTIAFALQIYCEFSGYTDIGRGVANMLGFDLILNFNLPYFAKDVRDFWRRWHMSLSTWIRDYLYIPLGGNRLKRSRTYFNLMVTMALAGLWHGAAAKFLFWGVWHGLGLSAQHWWNERRRRSFVLPGWVAWSLTMVFVLYGWLLFRAHSLQHIGILTWALTVWSFPPWWKSFLTNLTALAAPLILIQVWQYRRGDLLAPLTLPFWERALLQGTLLMGIAAFWERDASPFIYFQF
jgi:alginate O-acetyltransferase complex protein AlgI